MCDKPALAAQTGTRTKRGDWDKKMVSLQVDGSRVRDRDVTPITCRLTLGQLGQLGPTARNWIIGNSAAQSPTALEHFMGSV